MLLKNYLDSTKRRILNIGAANDNGSIDQPAKTETQIRQEIISSKLNTNDLRIIEIGALDYPTFVPDKFDIKFIDYASKAELMGVRKEHPRYTKSGLVEVDYVIPSATNYSRHIRKRFDLAVANHVIEHIPNTIGWLKAVHSILSKDGYLFLSIPDRRFTFDYLRPETTVADVLWAYELDIKRPGVNHIFEHFYYYRDLKTPDFTDPILISKKIKEPREAIGKAWARARSLHQKRPYVDVHCNVYTYDSCTKLLDELREIGLLGFKVVYSQDVMLGKNEFHVLLRKI